MQCTRWDIDKTYLRSEFYSLRELLESALERPDQKLPIPGAARLLSELGKSFDLVHILSGSPEQLRAALSARLKMDGVRFDILTLKPNLQNLLKFRWFLLKDQLSYKLPALLAERRRELVQGRIPSTEVLVGDDSEADAFIYSLYADIALGRISNGAITRILDAGRVFGQAREATLSAAREVAGTGAPHQFLILIHLERQTKIDHFLPYGRRLVPFFNYGQAALCLLERGLLPLHGAYAVVEELILEHRFKRSTLARSYLDLFRRGHLQGAGLPTESPNEASPFPETFGVLNEATQLVTAARHSENAHPSPSWLEPNPDYEALARVHAGGKNRR